MGLEHLSDPLIHWLQQRCGVGWQKHKLDITTQGLQHIGMGGGVIKDHQDMEGEVVSHTVLLQLGNQGILAVRLGNRDSHPASCNGIPMHRQTPLVITLKNTRVLRMANHDRLYLTIDCQVCIQQQSEMVLEYFEAWCRLLLLRDVLSRSKVSLLPRCKKSKPAVEIKERGWKKYLLDGRKMSSSSSSSSRREGET